MRNCTLLIKKIFLNFLNQGVVNTKWLSVIKKLKVLFVFLKKMVIIALQIKFASVAELVDALVLGTSIYDVGVRVSPLAPLIIK